MSKPVHTPEFWAQRIQENPQDEQRIIWTGTPAEWTKMDRDHRGVLERIIQPTWSVLDIGCGYGRLLTLMPTFWTGSYLGVDISPELLLRARLKHPRRTFLECDLSRDIPMRSVRGPSGNKREIVMFDIGIGIMIRHMLTTHVGPQYFESVMSNLKRVCKRMVFLEPEGYDISPELAPRGTPTIN